MRFLSRKTRPVPADRRTRAGFGRQAARGRTPRGRPRLRAQGPVLLLAAAATACVVGNPGPSRSTSQGDITRPELEQILSESAYQAVEQLRPSWLFYRRTPTISNPNPEPAVYVDQAKLLALDDLRSIPVQDVERIRFLSSRDATTIYGTGHMWGAIVVTTRRPGGQ